MQPELQLCRLLLRWTAETPAAASDAFPLEGVLRRLEVAAAGRPDAAAVGVGHQPAAVDGGREVALLQERRRLDVGARLFGRCSRCGVPAPGKTDSIRNSGLGARKSEGCGGSTSTTGPPATAPGPSPRCAPALRSSHTSSSGAPAPREHAPQVQDCRGGTLVRRRAAALRQQRLLLVDCIPLAGSERLCRR